MPLAQSKPKASHFDKAVMVNKHRKVVPLVVVSLFAACTGAEDETTRRTASSREAPGVESLAASAGAARSSANADTQARIAQLRAGIDATQERQASLTQRRTELSQQVERHQTDGATLLATIKSERLELQAGQAAGGVGSSTTHFDEAARIRLEQALVEDQRLASELVKIDDEIQAANSRRQALMDEFETLTLAGSVDVDNGQ
jgi:chromosome segregation ATPase